LKLTGRLLILAGLLCLPAGPTLAIDADRSLLDGQLKNMPSDVVALAVRALKCRKWSIMEIADEATDRRVQHALDHLRCDSLATDMVSLRRKYAQSPPALQALKTAGDIGL
jgi:hypothetical protein